MTQPSRPSRPSRTITDLPEHRDDRVLAPKSNGREPSRAVGPRPADHLRTWASRGRRDRRDGRLAGSTATPHPRLQVRSVTSEGARQ